MNPQTKRTLREIFIKNGLDEFDVFLLNEADWPQEARDLVAADRANREPDIEGIERAAHARERGERFDQDFGG